VTPTQHPAVYADAAALLRRLSLPRAAEEAVTARLRGIATAGAAALPPGWVLEPDGRTARRDGRLLHRHGLVLVVGLVAFGAAAVGLFWSTFPRGWAGVGRAVVLLGVLLLAGGLIAPAVTRALHRR